MVHFTAVFSTLQNLRASLDQALEQTAVKKRVVWRQFWGTHQRFFKLLCVCMKVSQASRHRVRRWDVLQGVKVALWPAALLAAARLVDTAKVPTLHCFT